VDVCFTLFFSSRRRHTRSKRDWSSDVCSSDLLEDEGATLTGGDHRPHLGPVGRDRQGEPVLRHLEVPQIRLAGRVTERRARFLRSEERRVGKEANPTGAQKVRKQYRRLARTGA